MGNVFEKVENCNKVENVILKWKMLLKMWKIVLKWKIVIWINVENIIKKVDFFYFDVQYGFQIFWCK